MLTQPVKFVEKDERVNLLGLTRSELEAFFADLGEKAFRASQVFKWLHQVGVDDFDAMTNLSKALRTKLHELACIKAPEVVTQQDSHDGSCKWVLRLDGGNCIEMVYIPEGGRATLCVSSQVGCALECSFCATAQQGFNRNLTSAEIVGQIWIAQRTLQPLPGMHRNVSNVVFMGMGEPLLNVDNVVRASQIMQDDFAYGLSKRRVTLSTAGVIPGLDRLREVSDIALAVSLHAPNDVLRDQLMPINRKYPIKELISACNRYVEGHSKRRVTFEYVMLDGVNDSPEHARELAKLLRKVPAKVNLIPFNPFPETTYKRSKSHAIEVFRDILHHAGLTTITRKTRGDDIAAACGQLAGEVLDKTKRTQRRRAMNQKME